MAYQVRRALGELQVEHWPGIFGPLFGLDFHLVSRALAAGDGDPWPVPTTLWRRVVEWLVDREGGSLTAFPDPDSDLDSDLGSDSDLTPDPACLARYTATLEELLASDEFAPLHGSLFPELLSVVVERYSGQDAPVEFPRWLGTFGCAGCVVAPGCPWTGVFPCVPYLVTWLPRVDIFVQQALAGHYCTKVRFHLARRAVVSPEVLGMLADDPDPRVRLAVAAHPASTTETLRVLLARSQEEDDGGTDDALELNRHILRAAWGHPNATEAIRLMIGFIT